MISTTSVIPFAICRPAYMTSTIGTLGRLLFRVVAHSHFRPSVLLLMPGFLLLLFLRHQLLLKTLISRRVDPFCWWQKGGDLFWWSYLRGLRELAFIIFCIWIWVCSLFVLFALCVCVRLAWTSKLVWTYLFLIWQLSLLSIYGICVWLCIISYSLLIQPSTTCLEVFLDGWR